MRTFLVVVLLSFSALAVAEEEVPVYLCEKVGVPPVIDGVLDDEVWKSVPVITPFRLATTGATAEYETKAQMCWDDENIYLGFYCRDNAIWGTLTEKDSYIFNEEVVEVFFRPDTEALQYFEFEVSPRNVILDTFVTIEYENGPFAGTAEWDCSGFEHAVFVKGDPCVKSPTDEYWTAEFSVPFSCMVDEAPEAGDEWRGNLYRIELGDTDEFQAWSPTFIKYPHFHKSLRFGRFQFVDSEQ